MPRDVADGRLSLLTSNQSSSPLHLAATAAALRNHDGGSLLLTQAAITIIPEPSLLLLTQVGSTALLVLVPALLGVTPQRVQIAPERRVALAYLMVAAVFLGTIYSNIRMLQYIGVNTFIVLRCSTPLVVSVLDWALMGRQLPSRRSAAALTGVLLCGAAYAWLKSQSMHEAQRTTLQGSSMSGDAARSGLFWTACWFGFFLADMLFIKHICDSYPCNGLERTLYQNGLATPMLALAFLTSSDGAHSVNEATARLTSETAGVAMVLASCLAGLVLSYAGLSLRSEISSTAFTVLGVVCKMGACADVRVRAFASTCEPHT